MKNKKLVILLILMGILSSGCGKVSESTGNPIKRTSATTTDNSKDNAKENDSSNLSESENKSKWKTVYKNDIKKDFIKCGFLNENIGIACGFTGENYLTYDYGENWITQMNKSNNTNAFDILDEKTIWYGDDFGDVGVSIDSGKTFSFNKSVFIERVSYIDAIDTKNALMGSLSKLSYTNDGGKTVTDIKLPSKIDLIAGICMKSKEEFYVLGFNGILYHSKDKFKTFDEINVKSGNEVAEVRLDVGSSSSTAAIRVSDKKIVIAYCGKDKGVYYITSDDEGKTWIKEEVSTDYANSLYLSKDMVYLTYNSGLSTVNVMKK